MTSIIGYTRVPFNALLSKHFTIAPVKQMCANKPPSDQDQRQPNSFISKTNSNPKRPSYHRIFSREMSRDGIIELIVDKTPMTNRTIGTQDSRIVHKYDKASQPHPEKPIKYNVLLSIDLSGEHDYDTISTLSGDSSYGNLQRLMDSLSRIAQEKSLHFLNILHLLKKLQSQKEHRFISCIDRYNEKVLIYIPSTISSSSVERAYTWLKNTIGIDVNKFKKWNLSAVEQAEQHDAFDGESYFKEIHMFIDHVDLLIESNGLFFHHQNQEPIR